MKHGSHFNQDHKHLIPLEILNGAFVFLRRSLCPESAEISSFARLRIFLARIKSILPAFQFPDHDSIDYSRIKWTPRVELERQPLRLRNHGRQAKRLPYKGFAERLEIQSTTNAVRIARLVAR